MLLSELKEKDLFYIKGRGLVACIDRPKYINSKEDVAKLIGWRFLIEGKEYEIVSTDFFMKLLPPPILGNTIGLNVKKITNGGQRSVETSWF